MEISSPEEFIEVPVIDIECEFVGQSGMAWTINDLPESPVIETDAHIRFRFKTAEIADRVVEIQKCNVTFHNITRRIDRIPKKSEAGKRWLERNAQ